MKSSALLAALAIAALPFSAGALSTVPPTAVGVVGIDLETGEVLWEAWQKNDVPEAFRPLTDDVLFDENEYARTDNFRPPEPTFGLPATSGDWSIAMGETKRDYLPDEIVLIRSRNGTSVAEKAFKNVGFCVNALGDHFYYVHPSGTLQVFRITLDDGDDPWKPVREIELVERLPGDRDFSDHAHVRLFVRDDRVYVQIPHQLYCFEEDGTLAWRTSTKDFARSGGYSEPSHLHFAEQRIYIQDSRGVAPIELADGEMGWKAPLDLGFYPDSCALFSKDGSVGIFSSEYYHEHGFPFASSFASDPPEKTGFGELPGEAPKLNAKDCEKFLVYIEELQAFGSRAMQVLLREHLDDAHAVPPQVHEQVQALVSEDWPELRSEARRDDFFVTCLVDTKPSGFDRIRAWKRFVPWEAARLFQTQAENFEQGEGAEWLAAEVLLPSWPEALNQAYPRVSAEVPGDLLSEARQTFATVQGGEKYLAASVLIAHCDRAGGATQADAETWMKGADIGLRTLAAPALAHYLDRKQLLARIDQESSSAVRRTLYRSLAAKPGGDPSDDEIALWLSAATEEISNYQRPSFIAVFRESRDGKIPQSLEQALRPALLDRLKAASSYEQALPVILHLNEFRNPADDPALAEARDRLGERYEMDMILQRRAARKARSSQ